jgi:hypothetical protein
MTRGLSIETLRPFLRPYHPEATESPARLARLLSPMTLVDDKLFIPFLSS